MNSLRFAKPKIHPKDGFVYSTEDRTLPGREKTQNIFRLFTGSDADEITARCQTDVRFYQVLTMGCLSDAIFYGKAMLWPRKRITFPFHPFSAADSLSFLIPDYSTWLVRDFVSVL